MDSYKVIFRGQLTSGLQQEIILQRLEKVFKISSVAAEKILTEPPKTLKSTFSKEEAIKYQLAFKKVGLITEIKEPLSLAPVELTEEPVPTTSIEPSTTPNPVVDSINHDANPQQVTYTQVQNETSFISNLTTPRILIGLIGIFLLIAYHPLGDGIIRNGFALGVASLSLSLFMRYRALR